MASNSTTSAGSSNNNNIVRDNVKSANKCVECGEELRSDVDGVHESLCSLHQYFSAGGELLSSSTAADSSSNNISDEFGVDWAAVKWPNDCEKCGRRYDCIDDNHESVCGVCQILFGGDQHANTSAAVDSTTREDPRRKDGQRTCPIDNRLFSPNGNNNGRHCTYCCNKRAGEGFDLWAEVGLVPTPKAQALLRAYQERH